MRSFILFSILSGLIADGFLSNARYDVYFLNSADPEGDFGSQNIFQTFQPFSINTSTTIENWHMAVTKS